MTSRDVTPFDGLLTGLTVIVAVATIVYLGAHIVWMVVR